jgi:phosphatidylserine/phosphatidylglycerophosphate/cardiolipin synthase-like enzyme
MPQKMLMILCGMLIHINSGWGQHLSPTRDADRTAVSVPVISGLTYDMITHNGVTLHWNTDQPSDSRVYWMVSDSNYQPVVYTDSLLVSDLVTGHSLPLTNLQTATMYRFLAVSAGSGGIDSAQGYFITRSNSSGKVTVWFNHTVDTVVSTGTPANGKTDFQTLIKTQIDKASHSIDITLWEFSQLDSVAQYLIRARDRGVRIRFVYNHLPDSPQIDTLKAHGIQIVKRNFDTSFSMHNKFWIFDHRYNTNPENQYLWTGSTNVTHTQFHTDRNNVIIIQDQALCEVYTHEFEEMWGSHNDRPDTLRSKFGIQKCNNTARILNVGGVRMEVYFAPTDSIGDTLVNLFTGKPLKSVYFSMLKFVFPTIETALHEAYRRGIQVSGVFDSSCSVNHGSAFPRMKGENVAGVWQPPADVFIDTLPGLIHHKYSVINADTTAGEKITTTGSFNWELPAQVNNDENMLIIDDPVINNLYFQEFMARYRESGGSLLLGGLGIGHPDFWEGISGLECFPNPFRKQTTIRYTLERPEPVTLEIFDNLGRALYREVIPARGASTQSIPVDGSTWPEGVLVFRLRTGSGTRTLRAIHLPQIP